METTAQELMDQVTDIENIVMDKIRSINKEKIFFDKNLRLWDGNNHEVLGIDLTEEVFHTEDDEGDYDIIPFEEMKVDSLIAILNKLEELGMV